MNSLSELTGNAPGAAAGARVRLGRPRPRTPAGGRQHSFISERAERLIAKRLPFLSGGAAGSRVRKVASVPVPVTSRRRSRRGRRRHHHRAPLKQVLTPGSWVTRGPSHGLARGVCQRRVVPERHCRQINAAGLGPRHWQALNLSLTRKPLLLCGGGRRCDRKRGIAGTVT